MSAYQQACSTHTRVHHLNHLNNLASWDQAAYMPPKANDARSAALAEMATLLHRLQTDPALGTALQGAEDEALSDTERANLREMRRAWRMATALPEDLVQAKSLATSKCEHAWRSQRPANDWNGFAANLREVVALARQEAQLLSKQLGVSPYEALMDGYEPGMTTAEVDRIFGAVRQWLPGLIQRVQTQQAQQQSQSPILEPQGPFAIEKQRALCDEVLRLLGFDFEAGRLDVSTHPFCGGSPEDVRMTTRYREDEFISALMGTVHETGHGRYEQNRPRALITQPVSQARSMAIHESQSLSFEMQLGASRAFVGLLQPLVVKHLGDQSAFSADNLHRLITRVKPGYIRVDADEVTYPAHVILRYEIERPLIEGQIEVDDIPALWDAKMQELLGIDTRGNFTNGPMQDVHWPMGLFGYFPCYSLGAMYAAQWFATMRRAWPDLDERVARGDLTFVFDWLRTHIWSQGSLWPTAQLCERASGEPLNPAHFKSHLEARYLG
jgi:carboxypeptidase Taq